LETDEQWGCIPISTPNNFKFVGTVVARGAGKKTWNIKFDIVPSHNNIISDLIRTKLTAIGTHEEDNTLSQRGSRKT
jgi:hypothetical protein